MSIETIFSISAFECRSNTKEQDQEVVMFWVNKNQCKWEHHNKVMIMSVDSHQLNCLSWPEYWRDCSKVSSPSLVCQQINLSELSWADSICQQYWLLARCCRSYQSSRLRSRSWVGGGRRWPEPVWGPPPPGFLSLPPSQRLTNTVSYPVIMCQIRVIPFFNFVCCGGEQDIFFQLETCCFN